MYETGNQQSEHRFIETKGAAHSQNITHTKGLMTVPSKSKTRATNHSKNKLNEEVNFNDSGILQKVKIKKNKKRQPPNNTEIQLLEIKK